MDPMQISEEWARNMLLLAIKNNQAAELIHTLWSGGTFTLSPVPGEFKLIFLTAEMMEKAVGNSGD